MTYKSYPTKQSTPSRMGRKWLRREVFLHNRKLRSLAKKAARLARKAMGVQNDE